MRLPVSIALLCMSMSAMAADKIEDKFAQLGELLPTPTSIRAASGAPGHAYWQQRADYVIRAKLDESKRAITGAETITYHNNSPDTLNYVWVQLDQNIFRPDSDANKTRTLPSRDAWKNPNAVSFQAMEVLNERENFDGGFKIASVKGANGQELKRVINRTMMRVDLPQPLKPGQQFVFSIDWSYNIGNGKLLGGRDGYEHFKEDKNDIFEIAQWFPRMAAYYDVYGWQHKQFLGSGEFTLEFGDYDVQLTVPSDHVVSATGELANADTVLTATQRERLKQARTAKTPVVIVTQKEAEEAEKKRATDSKTWHFKAKNVRDFAWASSRKYIWDAQGYKTGTSTGLAMSFYPKEANPLWGQYSTQAIIHTIEQYNKFSLDYPYPIAQSVNGPQGGMEYPMLSFNGGRPTKDKKTGELTYSKRTKYGLISVIIHEVGHNYFPMIVNSDERQWTWMDEGLNSFVQSLAEQAWEENYPGTRGEPRGIVDYMKSQNQVPIMTNSESILQFGPNAYAKPAAGLHILRETILGRELFDFAFKEYAQRWKFKRPTPADFFRTMEDASGTDLDWFWRGWFYTTDPVDISIDGIVEYTMSSKDPEVEKAWRRAQFQAEPISTANATDKGKLERRLDSHPELRDFYNEHDDFTVTNRDRNTYADLMKSLEENEKAMLKSGKYFYLVDFSNVGGLVMPLILEIQLQSGKKYVERIPAEVWRYNSKKLTKLIVTDEPMVGITQDPYLETADIDTNNNSWPRKITKSRVELFKMNFPQGDMMQDYKMPLNTDKKDPAKDAKPADASATPAAAAPATAAPAATPAPAAAKPAAPKAAKPAKAPAKEVK
ncbi:M1 family metallopeptidase [Undibacterium cyanobacteriorum]|uniref:M1 family metallopeptidase n=1 Tax=Undibacterium cyanobacteriorum TaxID=3073561 RepID=A0ABY9RKP1_9BURK|nr:M1 family metallopeptidase [Undibacterium sp. 20NA77.5]WMW81409.1 M1 family metallopeptidase [Undibacterium sp. 20NA77.5]